MTRNILNSTKRIDASLYNDSAAITSEANTSWLIILFMRKIQGWAGEAAATASANIV
jgi:hypothetical protein